MFAKPATVGEFSAPHIQEQKPKNRYFDPPAPEAPEQLFGVNTEAIIQLGRAATHLGMLPRAARVGLRTLPHTVRMLPLIEQLQAGSPVAPEDVRPYRAPLRRAAVEAGAAYKPALTLGALALNVPFRHVINRKLEREFPARADEVIEKTRVVTARAEVEQAVNHLASFENPKQQLMVELEELAQTTTAAIESQRVQRVTAEQRGGVQSKTADTPKGIEGLVVRVVRTIRRFFGFLRRQPKVITEVTAADAGAGLEQMLHSLVDSRSALRQRLPLLSGLLRDRLPKKLPASKDHLAAAAPEILDSLFAALPKTASREQLIRNVVEYPHELRSLATRFKGATLRRIYWAGDLLPALHQVLPGEGAQVRDIYDQMMALLAARPVQDASGEDEDENKDEPLAVAPGKKRLRHRLRNLFRRSR